MGNEPQKAAIITDLLLSWYHKNKRVFPFRGTRDPYRVWLSEIMLQQTRTETAGPYYVRFLEKFPDVFSLARASEEEVLKAWEGLGYYSRARNLHKTAGLIAAAGGVFPDTAKGLETLPGIGPYAAAAIASIAFDEPVAAMDGNLSRVISRLFLVTDEADSNKGKAALKALGQTLMPQVGAGDMNQALMDLGATVCLPGTPDCGLCPLSKHCQAYLEADPSLLPVMKTKPAPKPVPVAVVLAVHQGKVALLKRKESLLKGLYVFPFLEGDDSEDGARTALLKLHLNPASLHEVAKARHVFTHRLWQMRIYLASVSSSSNGEGLVWADTETLKDLPLPTAMGKARELAARFLSRPSSMEDREGMI